jgi:hypothetical protein
VVQSQSFIRPLASRLVQGVVGVYRGLQPSLTCRSMCWSKLSNVFPLLIGCSLIIYLCSGARTRLYEFFGISKTAASAAASDNVLEGFRWPLLLDSLNSARQASTDSASCRELTKKSCTKNITLKGGQSEIADLFHSDKQVPIVLAAVLIHATTFGIKPDSSMIKSMRNHCDGYP